MVDQAPKIDLFIGRHGEAWRLYAAPTLWLPTLVRRRLDEHREALVREPDLAELEKFMFSCDAPYSKKVTTAGGVELRAAGRSAIALGEWLEGLVDGGGCRLLSS